MAQVPDPDDILRQIDVNNVAECATELNKLLRKHRTFNPINYGEVLPCLPARPRNAITRPIFIQFQQKSSRACPS